MSPLLVVSTILGYVENYPEQQVVNKLYLDFKLQSLKKMKTIDYLSYQKIGTGRLTQKVEDGALASRDVMVDFWLKILRWLLPTALFSLLFIYQVKKEFVLFILAGYVIVIIVSNFILKKLYSLKEKILVNQEFLNKHLVRGFMELVVFRTNKKYDTEIKVSKDGIKNIVDGKTKIKLVHELFFSLFALIGEKQSLYLPVDNETGKADFKKWENGTKLSSNLKTVRSAKDFFFPQTESLMEFKTDGRNIEVIDTRSESEDFVIFGFEVIVWDCTAKFVYKLLSCDCVVNFADCYRFGGDIHHFYAVFHCSLYIFIQIFQIVILEYSSAVGKVKCRKAQLFKYFFQLYKK